MRSNILFINSFRDNSGILAPVRFLKEPPNGTDPNCAVGVGSILTIPPTSPASLTPSSLLSILKAEILLLTISGIVPILPPTGIPKVYSTPTVPLRIVELPCKFSSLLTVVVLLDKFPSALIFPPRNTFESFTVGSGVLTLALASNFVISTIGPV